MKRAILRSSAAITAALLMLTACKTTDGAGDDSPSLVEKAGADCMNPLKDTFECFDGKLIEIIAGDPAVIGTFDVPPTPKRPPQTLSFDSARDGAKGAYSPVDLAGRRVHAPVLEAYARDILAKLLAHSPNPPPPIAVHIISNDKFGGAATGENDIFVHLGTFNESNIEDTVASLLAHEAAHILLKHFDRVRIAEQNRELGAAVVSGAVFASSLKNTAEDGTTGSLETDEEKAKQSTLARRAALANKTYNFVATDVIGSAWSRRQEDEADLMGLDLLVAAGYNRAGAIKSMQILQALYNERETTEEKLGKALTSALEGFGETGQKFFASLITGAQDEETEDAALAYGIDSGEAILSIFADSIFRAKHLSPDERMEQIRAYSGREYRGMARSEGNPDRLASIKRKADFERLMRRYTDVEAAVGLLAEGEFDAAELRVREGLGGSVRQDPYPREVYARILAAKGDYSGAVAQYAKVRPGSIFSLSGYNEKAINEMLIGRNKTALVTLEVAATHYGEETFYPLSIRANGNLKNKAEVQAIGAACEADDTSSRVQAMCEAELSRISPAYGGTLGIEKSKGALGVLGGLLGAAKDIGDAL